jgi:hypothetical protein
MKFQHSISATHRQNQIEEQKKFNKKLCKALVESNIPLNKVNDS